MLIILLTKCCSLVLTNRYLFMLSLSLLAAIKSLPLKQINKIVARWWKSNPIEFSRLIEQQNSTGNYRVLGAQRADENLNIVIIESVCFYMCLISTRLNTCLLKFSSHYSLFDCVQGSFSFPFTSWQAIRLCI